VGTKLDRLGPTQHDGYRLIVGRDGPTLRLYCRAD
jgi:hypothetical protein